MTAGAFLRIISTNVIEFSESFQIACDTGATSARRLSWTEKVYKPDILAKLNTLYKQPGYKT